jgi:arylsulfatase A
MPTPRGTRRDFLKIIGAGAATLPLARFLAGADNHPNGRLPNIVIIFTDDQGYSDVGVYGARGFHTPNLDRMASEGVRFTDFYVAQPVCSASRAALLTGCYPNRIGITGALGPNAEHGIDDDEVTIAELCKSKGYATAIFGKWHLGHHKKFLPVHHGFDEYCGIPYSNDMWPLHPDLVKLPPDSEERKRGYPSLPLIEGDEIVDEEITPDDQEQFTTLFTERAVKFIERNRDHPFFLYVPHPMPHVPLFCSDKVKGKSEQGAYGDVISEIDWSVGQILETLRRLKLDDDTLVIFTTDNGPWLSYGNHAGSARPLREGKGTTWEGGVRVPCIMRWPGRIPAGSVCREPAMTIDIFPTIARLIDGCLPHHTIDGQDIWPLISGVPGAKSPHEVLYFYYHQNDLEALRSGHWKLALPHTYRSLTGEPGRDGTPRGYSYPSCELELYDLESDVGEQHNVIAQHPDVVERLQAFAEKARDDLGDSLTDREGKNIRPPGRL